RGQRPDFKTDFSARTDCQSDDLSAEQLPAGKGAQEKASGTKCSVRFTRSFGRGGFGQIRERQRRRGHRRWCFRTRREQNAVVPRHGEREGDVFKANAGGGNPAARAGGAAGGGECKTPQQAGSCDRRESAVAGDVPAIARRSSEGAGIRRKRRTYQFGGTASRVDRGGGFCCGQIGSAQASAGRRNQATPGGGRAGGGEYEAAR